MELDWNKIVMELKANGKGGIELELKENCNEI